MDDHEHIPEPESPNDASASELDTTPITLEQALIVLSKGSIEVEHGMLRYSSNYTFLLSACYENVTIPVVYKPQKGERPLWDFPDGTLCKREVASFHTSQALDWQIVPPTVLRDGPRGLGSMQFFVDHDPEHNYFSFDERMIPQLQRMVAFDAIANNADRKGGHCLVDAAGHLWGIDHGLTFHYQHKLRTVIWDFAAQPIPEAILADIEKLCMALDDADGDYRKTMADLMAQREIDALQGRVDKLLQTRRYPKPGPGPNYPWPPV